MILFHYFLFLFSVKRKTFIAVFISGINQIKNVTILMTVQNSLFGSPINSSVHPFITN